MTTTIPTRREERRQDEIVRAQIARDDDSARQELRAAGRKAAQARKLTARRARAASLRNTAAWLAAHAPDLILVPVILVPAVLAWSAVADAGKGWFGAALGWTLPALTEGAPWACAARVAIVRRLHPGTAVWRWQAAIAAGALFGAVVNFLNGEHGGIAKGAVMALVSVCGIAYHQLVTAGPRRAAEERRAARLERRAALKIYRAQKDAVDGSEVDLSAPGGPRLVTAAGPSPEPVAEPSESAAAEPSAKGPEPVTVSIRKHRHGTLALTFTPAAGTPSAGTVSPLVTAPIEAETDGPEKPSAAPPLKAPAQPRARLVRSTQKRVGRYAKVDALITRGDKTNAAIASEARVSVSTVERRRRALRETSTVVELDERRHA